MSDRFPSPRVFDDPAPALRTIEANAHVAAAAYVMKHADATALAVVDTHEPEQALGVITAVDVTQVIADGKNVNEVRIFELMIPKQRDSPENRRR